MTDGVQEEKDDNLGDVGQFSDQDDSSDESEGGIERTKQSSDEYLEDGEWTSGNHLDNMLEEDSQMDPYEWMDKE